jgi:hypothetical protein
MITEPVPVSPQDTPKPRRSHQSARALTGFIICRSPGWTNRTEMADMGTTRNACTLQSSSAESAGRICHCITVFWPWGRSRCVAAASWAGWPPDRVAAAKISNAPDTLVGTNEALAGRFWRPWKGARSCHARRTAGHRYRGRPWLVLRRRSSADTPLAVPFLQFETVKTAVSAPM